MPILDIHLEQISSVQANLFSAISVSLCSFKAYFFFFFRWIGYRFPFLCLLLSIPGFSQEYSAPLDATVAEKIYLQLNSSVYATDQTIWFKAIVTDMRSHLPSQLSGVLYVDLIDPKEQVIEHKLIKLEHGLGSGSLELKEDYIHGRYLLRAYTQWNLNFGEEFMFKSYISLHGTSKDNIKNPYGPITMIKRNNGQYFLNGQLYPPNTTETNEKEIQVFLDWGGGKDTISVKRKGENNYPLGYEVPKKPDWLTLTFEDGQKFRHTETLVLNDSLPDVQFFPESGQLVHGLLNKIGFKAVGLDGMGRKIRGAVFDVLGNKVADFESNQLGMGIFSMIPDSAMTYHAKISVLTENNQTYTYPLPSIVSKGSIISVEKAENNIRINVSTNNLFGLAFVKVSCRDVDYYLAEGKLREGRMGFELAPEKLPDGIIVFTLMDSQKNPIAERLYFNESIEDRIELKLVTNKNLYERREETKLDIQVSEDNIEVPTCNMSVVVMNKEHWQHGTEENILTYFLLSSELRGEIEDPGYYFDGGNADRFNELDALFMTQGWRNYKYPVDRQGHSFFWPQPELAVKGTVRSLSPKKISVKDANITMITFNDEPSFHSRQLDSTGKYYFSLNNIYGTKMRVLLTAKDAEGKKSNFSISLDSLRTPKVNYEYKPTVRALSPIEKAVVAAKATRDQTRAAFDSLYGVTQLDEVVVEGYRLTPERQKAYRLFGEPDLVIEGDVLRSKEQKWSYGLYSILLFEYGDQVEIEQFSDGFMLAHIRGGRGEPTLLVVDGKLLTKEQYEFVPHMPPGIVESVELIKYAKFFAKQYLTVFPQTHPLEVPTLGHIISVYTKGGVGILGTDRSLPGTLDTSIMEFSPVKEFYAPKYNNPTAVDSQKPDLRSLIHWDPSIETNEGGKATINFYNGDISGEYIVIVEGIAKDGRIGYKAKTYRVGEGNP